MKPIFLLVVIILLIAPRQNASAGPFEDAQLSIQAGINLANVAREIEDEDHNEYGMDPSINAGINIGAFIELPRSERLSLKAGLLLSKKGYRIEDEVPGFEIDYKENLYYLDIPLLANLIFEAGPGIGSLHFGPSLGIGLWGNQSGEYFVIGARRELEEDIEFGSDGAQGRERLDIGLNLGVNYELERLLFGFNYGFGLSDISGFEDMSLYNRVFSINVGYKVF